MVRKADRKTAEGARPLRQAPFSKTRKDGNLVEEKAIVLETPQQPLTEKERRALEKQKRKEEKSRKKTEKAVAKAERKAEKRQKKLTEDAEKAIRLSKLRNAKYPLSFSEEQVAAFWQPVMDKVSQLRKEYAEKPLTLKDAKRIQKDIEKEEKKALKEQKNFEKEEKKRIEEGRLTMYEQFESYSFMEIEELLLNARTREEKAFYRSMLNLKLQIEQEKVIGEVLL